MRRNNPVIHPITSCLCDVNISPLRMLLHLEIDIQHQNKSNNFGRRIRSLSHWLDKCQNSRWQRQDPCRIDPALWRHLLSLQSIPCSRSRRLPDHTRCQRGIAFREKEKRKTKNPGKIPKDWTRLVFPFLLAKSRISVIWKIVSVWLSFFNALRVRIFRNTC